MRVAFLFALFLLPTAVLAQNQTCKWLKYSKTAQSIDSLSILPNSFEVQSKDSIQIIYDFNSNQITFSKPFADSILVCYRTLAFNLSEKRYKRNPAVFDSTTEITELNIGVTTTIVSEKQESILETPNLQKQGNYTRGISFGNRQSVFVNSALNLQLEGKIEDINILASISDQNVPFQPEGNTQQLQEFDRIFVQLSKNKSKLTAGDIVLRNQPQSYFLRYYKNIQGAFFEGGYTAFGNADANTAFGVAVSKGKFANIQLQALEGVQGPYRLLGPNGETFIIVLAGSEKVYLDGKLMQRGFNYDYTIDYNLAEITFNTNIVVTQFSRLRVEFEYSEQNYARSIVNARHFQKHNNFDLSINYYREADNFRNDLLGLTDNDKIILSEVGDDRNGALVSSIDSADFRVGAVLYEQIDITTSQGTFTNILQYSVDSTKVLYEARFSQVGQNQGNYILLNTTVNGRVFQWVEPIGGIPQGDYAPVVLVPLPQSKRMISFAGNYHLSRKEKLFGEIAFSDLDLNRFSEIDNEDNSGIAFKIGYENLGKKLVKNYQYILKADYEENAQTFTPIDRFRSIEFDRDWSTRTDTSQRREQIFSFGLGIVKDSLNKPNTNKLIYNLSRRIRTNQVNGWQQRADFFQRIGKLEIQANWFLMQNDLEETRSDWHRLFSDIGLNFPRYKIGARYNFDKNIVKLKNLDSLSTAMNFEEYVAYIKTQDSTKVQFLANYSFRTDFFPQGSELVKNTEAQTANFQFATRFLNNTQNVNLTTTYRKIDNFLNLSENQQSEENIMGRLDWNGSFWKRNIQSNLTFATATGRELRREFVYIPVAAGEGTHVWRDENEDNIQDLNEFYLAVNPDERLFIKIFTPTNEFITAFSNNFSYRLNIKMPQKWKDKKFLKKTLQKLSLLSTWTIQRRFTDDDLYNRLVPFSDRIANENLLSTQESLRGTLFFNRLNPKFGGNFNYLQTRQKQLLSNGFEARNREEMTLTTRRNIGKSLNVKLIGTLRNIDNTSDFLLTRNYLIEEQELSPELALQPSKNFRVIGKYRYNDKANILQGGLGETANLQQISLEIRWNKVGKRNLLATLRYIDIHFTGEDPNTAVGYEMLEALQVGTNWTWTVNWQQRIANGLQLTLNYEGRNSPNLPVVHVGRMQVSALF